MLLTDIPYLEPLLFHLRQDPELKKFFTDKSFFMPHHDLVEAITDSSNPDCPLPRSLWILPGDTAAINRKPGCVSAGLHSFSIAIAVKCIYDAFTLSKKNDGDIHLEGQFMELTRLRKLVKKSVNTFAKNLIHVNESKYNDLVWIGDQNLYPNEEQKKILATAINFEVTIFS